MKKTTLDSRARRTAARILLSYREAIRENQENPTSDNWEDVKRFYHRVSTLGMLEIISGLAQQRAMTMFEDSTAII